MYGLAGDISVIVVNFISTLLHILGIYLLAAVNRCISYQNILLINLSASEIMFNVAYISLRSFTIRYTPMALKLTGSVLIGVNVYFYSVMLAIIIDRFIAVIFPLKHRVIVTKHRIKTVLAIIWITSVVTAATGITLTLALTGHLLSKWDTFMDVLRYFVLSLDISLALAFTVTYGAILVKIVRRRQIFNGGHQTDTQRRKTKIFQSNKRFFKVAGSIILTYIIFFLIPDIVFVFCFAETDVEVYADILHGCGMISFPLIYIFMQPEIRKLLRLKFCKNVCTQRSLDAPSAPSATAYVNESCV